MAPKTRRSSARTATASATATKPPKKQTKKALPVAAITDTAATPAASTATSLPPHAPTTGVASDVVVDATVTVTRPSRAAAAVTFAPIATAETKGHTIDDVDAPRKKRRTLRDAEQELDASRHALHEAKRHLIATARENAKMKVLLLKYMTKDDSLLCTSQLSFPSQQEPPLLPQPPHQRPLAAAVSNGHHPLNARTGGAFDGYSTQSTSVDSGDSTAFEESEQSENSSLWTSSEFQQTEDADAADADVYDTMLNVGPVSQLSQMSQWSEFSSTSNLDEIITFLEKQDTVENDRVEHLQSDFKELQAQKTHVRVGVGVLLTSLQHPQCVLIGERKGSHGAGKLALPGGHLEMYESWEECAIREVKEETNLDISSVAFAFVTNDPMADEGKHYITIFVHARVDGAQAPVNMEPDKCAGWRWEPWQRLRTRSDESMFLPLFHLTRSAFTPPAM